MKKLNLFFLSFSQSVFSSIILIILLSVALISVQDVIGQYRYITHSRYIIENEYLENSDYFMIDLESLPVEPDKRFENTKSIREKISSFDGVDGIAYSQSGTGNYRSSIVNIKIYNEYMEKAFGKELSEGKWFEEADSSSNIPNVVVTGAIFDDIPVGSDISIKLNDGVSQKVHIIGKIGYPWYAADYSTISDDVSTKNFLIQSNQVIFDDTDWVYELLNKSSDIKSLSFSYFVLYNNNCTEEQKTAVRDYMETVGTYASYDTILENTENDIHEELIKSLITPIFLLIIATIMLISISTLNTYKKLKEHSIYYLCGCSRKKSFAYLFAEISFVAIAATIINIIYVFTTMSQLMSGNMGYGKCIIDYNNILFSMIYCIITIVITVILPFIVYKKNTPLEIYRRNHND